MAANFNSDIQTQQASSATDGLQTLILMNHQNPNNDNNFVFVNPSMSSSEHTHQLVGIPLRQTHHHETISPLHGLIPRPQYNLWTPVDASTAAREAQHAQQGLSLSLSNSQQQRQVGFDGSGQPVQLLSSVLSPSGSKDDGIGTPSPGSVISNGQVSGMRSVLMSSKYLKATQQLLEEVVNVGSATSTTDSAKKKDKNNSNKGVNTSSELAAAGDIENGTSKVSPELSTSEKQEFQMKKGKLVCILNEVDQRYRQYHHQMQIVIASFEQAAGQGSAKSYTALALRTISRQFRCLKDAIMTHIMTVNKALGEEDIGGKDGGSSSRLKFVDHHLRQQRALQQLGMMHHNAWRPQRGLPERSVSVLRAWLFEHFLHPYPKDSDKHMLAKQTGLTRSQVSNWFINARVRLWKPMVEEMYNEELKDQENEGPSDEMGNNGEASTSKVPTEGIHNLSFKNASHEAYRNEVAKTDSVSPTTLRNNQTTGFGLLGSSELEGITQMSPKRQRINDQMLHHHHPTGNFQSNMEINPNDTSNEHVLVKFGIERQPRDDYSLMAAGPANFIGGFGSFPMEEIGRFDTHEYNQPRFSGNGVSLTLGLNDTPQSFLPNQSLQSGHWRGN